MEITKLSTKGQLVIPSKIRTDLGITEGSLVAIEQMKDMIMIKKVDLDLVNHFKKSLADVKAGRIKRVA